MKMKGDGYTKLLSRRIKEADRAYRFWMRQHELNSLAEYGNSNDFDEAQRQFGIGFGLMLALVDYRTAKGWLKP